MKVTARLSGDTRKIKTALSGAGWKWMPIFLSWTKDVDITPDLMAGKPAAVKAIGANMKGCILMIDAGGIPVEVWRSQTYVGRVTEAQRVGCDACGDQVPVRRSPRGWLCDDCANE
jgi:hypothetical protein